jgi:hypothetical protein
LESRGDKVKIPQFIQSCEFMNESKSQNHKIYIQILQRIKQEERLRKVFELSELSKQRFMYRLRRKFPSLTEEELKQIHIERLIQKSKQKLLIFTSNRQKGDRKNV